MVGLVCTQNSKWLVKIQPDVTSTRVTVVGSGVKLNVPGFYSAWGLSSRLHLKIPERLIDHIQIDNTRG